MCFSFSWTISGRRRLLKNTSAMRLPLSVTTGPTLPVASLRTVFSEIFLIFATVDAYPKGTISTGMGCGPPRVLASFFSSTMMTSFFEVESTIFSRSSSRFDVLRPSLFAAISVWYDVGMKVIFRFSFLILSAASSMARRIVFPLPSPMVVLSLISLTACAAALIRALSVQDSLLISLLSRSVRGVPWP